ncbi:winged helix-turn-helix transcriptional regulator [Kitasatospora sp. NRRL B-11411]|uniref:winged helix-turn-helix transcriptional regulator n=1 Tax=Kitasatospora sp. NRRL B-11411 TaxID=1463822 RepID=UPI0004C36403|nr:winged helix-turn-helix transcriptional regulator [Kitasatospora sp. NRRL B-11411]
MPSTSTADPQAVETALRRLAPNWTTDIVRAIAKYGPTLPVREVAGCVPALSESYASKRLAGMRQDGLVDRDDAFDKRAPYRLSRQALTLGPVYRSLTQWSSEHVAPTMLERPGRIEDALQRLQPIGTTKVVQLLAEGGSMDFNRIAAESGVYRQLLAVRIARLQADGLVVSNGSRNHGLYTLTEAGQALGPVYATVQQWHDRHTAKAPARSGSRVLTVPEQGVQGARTAAALRRSPVPSSLFSHAPQPQPPVPYAVTAASHPARGR